jgi:predicted peptidase
LRSLHSICSFASLFLLLAPTAESSGFIARTFRSPGGATLPYRLFIPEGYDAQRKYPLVLWLHGATGRGSDNLRQVSDGNTLGSHVWITPENQARLPVFVLAPQCPADEYWSDWPGGAPGSALKLALATLDAVEKEFSIDPDRVYVAGQSMGGAGTWAALALAPGRFAAAVPLCGYFAGAPAPSVVHVPVWVFQGAADPVVDVAEARKAMGALREAGGTPKYTEYPGVKHNVWEKAFAEPELVPWVAAHKRNW